MGCIKGRFLVGILNITFAGLQNPFVELIQGFFFRHSDPSVKSWVVLVSTNEILGAQNCDPLNILKLTFSPLKIGGWGISSLSFLTFGLFSGASMLLVEGRSSVWNWQSYSTPAMAYYYIIWKFLCQQDQYTSFFSHEFREFFEFLGLNGSVRVWGEIITKIRFHQAPNSFSLLQNCSSFIFGPVSTHGCFQK